MTTQQHCITCNEDGHTYMACHNVPFMGIFGGALGLPDLLGEQAKAAEYLQTVHTVPQPEA